MLFVNLDKEIEEVEKRMLDSQPNPEDTRDLDYITGLKRARKILDTELADIKINTDIDPKQAIRLLEMAKDNLKGKVQGLKKRIGRQTTTIETLRNKTLKIYNLDPVENAGKVMQVQKWVSSFKSDAKLFADKPVTIMMTNAGISVFIEGELFVIPEMTLIDYLCEMYSIGEIELG